MFHITRNLVITGYREIVQRCNTQSEAQESEDSSGLAACQSYLRCSVDIQPRGKGVNLFRGLEARNLVTASIELPH
jgi:hypothetical protein